MELLGWLRSSHPRPGFVQFNFSRSIAEKLVVSEPSAENRTVIAEKRTEEVGRGELIKLNLNPDSLTPPLNTEPSAENRTNFPNALQILAKTDLLFDGALVYSDGLEDREPAHVLAWCAYAHSNKCNAGLVRKRLVANAAPPQTSLNNWRAILPSDFLEALGLMEYRCSICQAPFKIRRALEDHEVTHPQKFQCGYCEQEFDLESDLDIHIEREHSARGLVVDPSALQPINGGMCAEQAWQSVLGQLQMEMPRASFDTWVRDTKAVRYDGNAISISVRNTYARDWLESRIESTVSRLLVGILRQSVQVEFVTE
jgi:hypothetical protein